MMIKMIHFIVLKLDNLTNKILNKMILPQKKTQQIAHELSMQKIYSHVQLILRYELLDKTISDKDSMDVLNTVFYDSCNGIILLRACSRSFMERILQDNFEEDTLFADFEINFSQLDDKALLDFMPEVYCEDVDIVELDDGRLKCYLVDYNVELEKIEGEDFYYDIFKRKGKS